ncbi:MAG: hypothetical protein M3Y30_01525 [Gemmatimonadota bacterium]|nr:hypothetical protein [Gemmatimonadota bacterium]
MRNALLAGLILLVTLPSAAQQANEQRKALYDKHKGDFDYLLGDWEWSGTNKQYGKVRGYWSAARLGEGGQLIDEYRVVGDNDETYYVTYTVRSYNAFLDRWDLVGLDTGSGLQNAGTGHREGGEVNIEQRFGVGTPNASTWRIHYSNIRPDAFSWSADRSTDDGKTWTKDFQQIEVRRIGPPRTIGPLTTPRKTPAPAH